MPLLQGMAVKVSPTIWPALFIPFAYEDSYVPVLYGTFNPNGGANVFGELPALATKLKFPATAARAKPVFVLAHECLPPIPAVDIRRMLPESVAKAGPTLFSGCAPAVQTGFEPATSSSAVI